MVSTKSLIYLFIQVNIFTSYLDFVLCQNSKLISFSSVKDKSKVLRMSSIKAPNSFNSFMATIVGLSILSERFISSNEFKTAEPSKDISSEHIPNLSSFNYTIIQNLTIISSYTIGSTKTLVTATTIVSKIDPNTTNIAYSTKSKKVQAFSLKTSSQVSPTKVRNNSIILLPSTTIDVHFSKSKWFSPFLISTTFVCSTKTIYLNCSSDFSSITPSPSSIVNISFSKATFTSQVDLSFYLATYTIKNLSLNSYTTLNFTYPASSISAVNMNSTLIMPTVMSSMKKNSSTSSSVYITAQIINQPIHECDVYLNEFTDAYTKLSKCMLHNIHPMRVCSNCSAHYEIFSMNHKKIFKDCGTQLIYDYNMQYQVIPKMFTAQDMTWKSLECDKCYTRNDAGEKQFSSKFKAFIHLYNDLNRCFWNHSHDSWIHSSNRSIQNTKYDRNICSGCYQLYNKMQMNFEYFGVNGEDSPSQWCADVNVAVNETRHRWSNDFKCGRKEKDLGSVIALTCFFCFLPIVFYVGAKLHTDVRERKIASRFNYDSE